MPYYMQPPGARGKTTPLIRAKDQALKDAKDQREVNTMKTRIVELEADLESAFNEKETLEKQVNSLDTKLKERDEEMAKVAAEARECKAKHERTVALIEKDRDAKEAILRDKYHKLEAALRASESRETSIKNAALKAEADAMKTLSNETSRAFEEKLKLEKSHSERMEAALLACHGRAAEERRKNAEAAEKLFGAVKKEADSKESALRDKVHHLETGLAAAETQVVGLKTKALEIGKAATAALSVQKSRAYEAALQQEKAHSENTDRVVRAHRAELKAREKAHAEQVERMETSHAVVLKNSEGRAAAESKTRAEHIERMEATHALALKNLEGRAAAECKTYAKQMERAAAVHTGALRACEERAAAERKVAATALSEAEDRAATERLVTLAASAESLTEAKKRVAAAEKTAKAAEAAAATTAGDNEVLRAWANQAELKGKKQIHEACQRNDALRRAVLACQIESKELARRNASLLQDRAGLQAAIEKLGSALCASEGDAKGLRELHSSLIAELQDLQEVLAASNEQRAWATQGPEVVYW
mmetsp:Transcript_64677/g.145897  ORF Transcript_64677/g.145897 Transcript_64677/m.145897 type:complete len:538 (+) Transcript_64677:174-1787(+)|eukprot:CAMPEP_0172601416 /NCGR_PEP_ID=MMETSP1068-20121228/21557_1 /TAXON_ID=35684 /ORGANISM="Pseudopedinella elastica, Strain CCMP716" /LENGTH=537 /DNA_ID=CAMNT_0013402383 /DNA_START=116 /DNA_END=1729 /DNA_ORIENTATION=+